MGAVQQDPEGVTRAGGLRLYSMTVPVTCLVVAHCHHSLSLSDTGSSVLAGQNCIVYSEKLGAVHAMSSCWFAVLCRVVLCYAVCSWKLCGYRTLLVRSRATQTLDPAS